MKRYIYRNEAKISFGKQVKSFFINFIILILLGIIVAFFNISYLAKSDFYQSNNQIVEMQIEIMLEMTDEAYLSKRNENNDVLSLNDMYKEYAIGHILLSYSQNEEEFNKRGIDNIEQNEMIKDQYSIITPKTDFLANLYYYYLPSLNIDFDYQGLTSIDYFKKVLNDVNKDLSMFKMDENYPSLKVDFAINLYNYIILEQTMDNQEGLNANTIFAELFQDTFEYNSSIFQNLDFYQVEYQKYAKAYQLLSDSMNVTFLISYSECFIILFVLLPLLIRNHFTLGELISGVIIGNYNEEKIKFSQYPIRIVVDYLLYFSSIFIIAFVLGGTTAITTKLFSIGNININMMGLISISLILCFVNYLVSYVTTSNRSLKDIISNSICLLKEELTYFND